MANYNPSEPRDEMGRWTNALTENNSMLPPSQKTAQPSQDMMRRLERSGYFVYPIGSLRVLYANPSVLNSDKPLYKQPVGGKNGYDLVVNGTFTSDSVHLKSAGAIMRNGVFDTDGYTDKPNRGGLAVLNNGTVVIGLAKGCKEEQIQNRFGQKENPVKEFMGGAALLIYDGEKVSGHSLWKVQQFDNGLEENNHDGLQAEQMRKTYHSLLGIRKGQAYLMVAKDKCGKDIQDDLFEEGFGSVIKLDGGSGCFLRDSHNSKRKYSGKNSVGLGIHCWKK